VKWLPLLLLAGCAGATCPAQLITDPAQAIAAQKHAPIRSLRAEAKIDQRGRDGRIKGKIMMFVERPDRVRFDAMTQFGPALILTSDGQNFALSDFKDNRYLSGPACAESLGRVIGVALASSEVASVLLGEAPLIAGNDSLSCSDGSYKLERRGDDGSREELAFVVHEADRKSPPASQRLYLAAATLWNARGEKLYRVRYEDYARVGAAEFPHTVRIDDFANHSDALLRLSDVAVDVKVPEGAFTQTPRAGLSIEAVECDGSEPPAGEPSVDTVETPHTTEQPVTPPVPSATP
jgi:outer membrane lipoprotein-sorting protein